VTRSWQGLIGRSFFVVVGLTSLSDAQLPPNAQEVVNLPASQIFGDKPARRSAGERRAFLEADTLAEAVEENRVKCRNCQKWIALRKKQAYDLHSWNLHRDKCSEDLM
jgi:hypothetical protein